MRKIYVCHVAKDVEHADHVVELIFRSLEIDLDAVIAVDVECLTSDANHSQYPGAGGLLLPLVSYNFLGDSVSMFRLGEFISECEMLCPLVTGDAPFDIVSSMFRTESLVRLTLRADIELLLDKIASVSCWKRKSYSDSSNAISCFMGQHSSYLAEHPCVLNVGIKRTEDGFVPVSSIEEDVLVFGVQLGWDIARYEVIFENPHAQSDVHQISLELYLDKVLRSDGLPFSIIGLGFSEMVNKVLNYYLGTCPSKAAAIYIGVAAFQLSIFRSENINESVRNTMRELAHHHLSNIDERIVPNRQLLIRRLEDLACISASAVIDLLTGR